MANILYNEIPIEEICFKKNFFGYVQQQTEILEDTLLNNILFGAEYDQLLISQVVKLTNLNELEDRLTSTVNNNSLSGGQKQKIGIARAIYRKPELLVFDEPTSSLDLKNEKFIIEIIQKIMGNHTIILISHKLKIKKLAHKTLKI